MLILIITTTLIGKNDNDNKNIVSIKLQFNTYNVKLLDSLKREQ